MRSRSVAHLGVTYRRARRPLVVAPAGGGAPESTLVGGTLPVSVLDRCPSPTPDRTVAAPRRAFTVPPVVHGVLRRDAVQSGRARPRREGSPDAGRLRSRADRARGRGRPAGRPVGARRR